MGAQLKSLELPEPDWGKFPKGPELNDIDMAAWFGCNSKYLYELARAKKLPKLPGGMFEAGPTVFAFIKHVYSTRSKGSSSSSIDAEKLRLTKAQADMAEYKAATQRGELHEGEDVRRVLSDMLVRFRSRILSMPTKVAGMVQGRELAEAEAIVRDLCREALQELSEYNPSMFFKARANGESEETESADSDD